MADIWVPGYVRVDLGWRGAPYDETSHPKLLWHTTEGTSLSGARVAFRSYPPHGCYDPWTDEAEQYIPLNYHAWSLLGSEADDEYVFQWEIVGRAGQSHTWPEWVLERLGRRVAAPIAEAVGVPAQHLRFYRADEGIVLARSTSPIRLSAAAFRAFSGHLGHQHAPAPDAHWDPGGLPIDRILAYANQEDSVDPSNPHDNALIHRVEGVALAKPVSGTGEVLPMVTHLLALFVRLEAVVELLDTITNPLAPDNLRGRAVPLTTLLRQIAADVADLKARPVAEVDEAELAAELEARGFDGASAAEVKAAMESVVTRTRTILEPDGGTP